MCYASWGGKELDTTERLTDCGGISPLEHSLASGLKETSSPINKKLD